MNLRFDRSKLALKPDFFGCREAFTRVFGLVVFLCLSCLPIFADEPTRQIAREGGASLGNVDVESGVPASLADDAPFPNVDESFPSSFPAPDEPTARREAVVEVGQETTQAERGGESNFDLSSFDDDEKSDVSATGLNGEALASSVLSGAPKALFGPNGISTSLKTILIMSLFTVAPAILLMTTSYVRISIVYSILRQALGLGQIPSNQVVATLAVFLTILIMFPVWSTIYSQSVEPYSKGEITGKAALEIGQKPLRDFLWKQIEKSGNTGCVAIFSRYVPEVETAKTGDDVPWRALAPAFLLSELKTAFLIGFQIFLPFLIIDVVVSCVLVSAGMMMLPPTVVSLPFKLILFVLVDGWTLITGSLLSSFA